MVAGFDGSAPTPPYPPNPPSLASLTLWVNGRTGITQSGGAVSEWADQSGNGNNLVQASGTNQPTLGSLNGKTALAFASTGSQFLGFPGPANILAASGYTLMAVWSYTGSATYTPGQENATMPLIFCVGTSQLFMNVHGAGNTGSDVTVFTADTATAFTPGVATAAGLRANPHQSYHAFDGSKTYCSIDKGAIASTANAGTLGDLSIATMGKGPISTSEYWDGLIGELLVWDTFLSPTDIATAQAFLTGKWGTLGP
jgi:hypothetical protein